MATFLLNSLKLHLQTKKNQQKPSKMAKNAKIKMVTKSRQKSPNLFSLIYLLSI
jgi:hypothetical protein